MEIFRNRKPIIMNAGISLIGLALVLLSVALMISPSTAIVTDPADCGWCVGFADDTTSDYCSENMTIPKSSSEYEDSIIFIQTFQRHR
jgi:hypothetical protein